MRRLGIVAVGLALVVATALLVAFGLPYGRSHPEAFAHVYTFPSNGNTTHLHIDADITNGNRPCEPIDEMAVVSAAATHWVGVCIEDYVPNSIESFELHIQYTGDPDAIPPTTINTAPTVDCLGSPTDPSCVNANPNANEGDDVNGYKLGAGWDCTDLGLMPPVGEDTGTPNVADAKIVCNFNVTAPDKDLDADPGLLATIQFTATGTGIDTIDFGPLDDTNLNSVFNPRPGGGAAYCGTQVPDDQVGCFAARIFKNMTPTPTPTATPGNSITSPDTAGYVGRWTSLVLDGADNPVVSYAWSAGSGWSLKDLRVLHCGNANCTAGNSITSPVLSATYFDLWNSLALDGAGNPVVAYYGGVLGVLHCNDPDCAGGDESITNPDAGAGGAYASLALDGAGNPVVAYRTGWCMVGGGACSLTVLHCNDPNCVGGDESISAVDTPNNPGWYMPDTHLTSLALDASGYPVVSYYDQGNNALKVLHCNDPNCVGGDESITSPDTQGYGTSLALDAAGNPVVSYYGSAGLRILHCNDPDCAGGDESLTNPDAGPNAEYTSLALDAAGNPVVSYTSAFVNTDPRVLHCNDPNCAGGDESITSPDTAPYYANFTSLALDGAGNPVVSYYDASNADLKVLHCDSPTCAAPTPTATPSPTPTATPTPAPDTDGDSVPDSRDSCPLVANPGQENADNQIGNGKGIPGHDKTVPNSAGDLEGDACETDGDIDNDGIADASDTDPGGDITYDDNNNGNPCVPLGTDGDDDGPSWDSNCNGVRDGVEGTCTTSTADADGDGLLDKWEECKWGTNPAVIDSDGDTLGDCKEAADVDGNGFVGFVGDTIYYVKAALLACPGPTCFGQDGDFDIDGNDAINFTGDVIQEAKFAFSVVLCK
jgi:hypothetical protein